jgi:hypothetical protein
MSLTKSVLENLPIEELRSVLARDFPSVAPTPINTRREALIAHYLRQAGRVSNLAEMGKQSLFQVAKIENPSATDIPKFNKASVSELRAYIIKKRAQRTKAMTPIQKQQRQAEIKKLREKPMKIEKPKTEKPGVKPIEVFRQIKAIAPSMKMPLIGMKVADLKKILEEVKAKQSIISKLPKAKKVYEASARAVTAKKSRKTQMTMNDEEASKPVMPAMPERMEIEEEEMPAIPEQMEIEEEEMPAMPEQMYVSPSLDKVSYYATNRDIINQVQWAYAFGGVRADDPYTISYTQPGMNTVYDFSFDNAYHFQNWKLLVEANHITDDGVTIDLDSEGRSNMTGASIDVKDKAIERTDKKKFDAVKIVGYGCTSSGDRDRVVVINGTKYTCVSIKVRHMLCAYSALEYIVRRECITEATALEYHQMCREAIPEIPSNIRKLGITINQMRQLIKLPRYATFNIELIDDSYEGDSPASPNVILCHNGHFMPVTKVEVAEAFAKDVGDIDMCHKGRMFVDFETRRVLSQYYYTEECQKRIAKGEIVDDSEKIYKLKDALCCVYYKKYQGKEFMSKTFVTNAKKSSAAQFVEFVRKESLARRYYTIFGHNAGNFDWYFVREAMTVDEIDKSEMKMRGFTITEMSFYGSVFHDTCLHLASSLHDLCKAFKVGDKAKMTKCTFRGNEVTPMQLCMYKPELNILDFVKLQDSEPDFWALYEEYCHMDVVSLATIWLQYAAAIEPMLSGLGNDRKIDSFLTIGSAAKKTFAQSVKSKLNYVITNVKGKSQIKTTWKRRHDVLEKLHEFTEYKEILGDKGYHMESTCNFEKEDMVRQHSIGGISLCNRPGRYSEGLVSYDINSQYPASMMYMLIPIGKSHFTDHFEPMNYGFYEVSDMVFADNAPKFKPVCELIDDVNGKVVKDTRNWVSGTTIKHTHTDSFMLDYLMKHCGLKSFKVIKGLVSEEYAMGYELYGLYVSKFYSEKMRQDVLMKANAPEYNTAIRAACKLFLNALSGKCVEDASRHPQYINAALVADANAGNVIDVHGAKFCKVTRKTANEFICPGVMVYSHSKRILHQYASCLPHVDRLVHTETDSLYFEKEDEEHFLNAMANYKGCYPIATGIQLGFVKKEHECAATADPAKMAYFLGKKQYALPDMNSNALTIKMKGISEKYTAIDGTQTPICSIADFIAWYDKPRIPITFTLNSMIKITDGANIGIWSKTMTRDIKPTAYANDK